MTTESSTPPAQFTHRQVLVIFSGLMLGMLLAALDQTIVATALPVITGELGGLAHLSWVVTAYILASAVTTPLYGKLGDLYGRKRLFQVSIVVFLIGSVLSGLSQSMLQLIAFRAIQGAGGGGLMVLAQAIVADVVSPRERGRYQGYFGAVFGVTSVAGPLLGGFFTDNLSWRWVFYINVPLGVIALIVTGMVLPAGVRRARAKIDYLGTAILTAAVSCIILLTTWGGGEYAWDSPMIIGLIVASIALVAILIPVERRAEEPMLPLSLFKDSTFSISSGAGFIIGMGMFGSIAFLPLFLQVVQGASATNSGLLLLPLMAGLLVASVGSGQVITRTGRYRWFPIAGTAIAALGLFLMSTMGAATPRWQVTLYMVVLGVGIGLAMQTLVLAVQNTVRVSDLGVATSAVTFFRSMGAAIGVSIFGAIFNAGLSSRMAGMELSVGEGSSFSPSTLASLPPEQAGQIVTVFADALTSVFGYAAIAMAAGVGVTFMMKEAPLRTTTHEEEPVAGRPGGSVNPAAAPAGEIL